jgi:hypothetical protein
MAADTDLDNDEAAEFLGIAAQTLIVWRMRGRSPEFYKNGRAVYYRRAVLEELQSLSPTKPEAPKAEDLGDEDELNDRRLSASRTQRAAAAALARLRAEAKARQK